MSKIYLENDHQIKRLSEIDTGKVLHPISKGSSLYLKQTPTSKRFIWRVKGKDISIGEWCDNTLEMLVEIKKAKIWLKQNPDSNPRLYFDPEQDTTIRTFYDSWKEFWEWYVEDTKGRTHQDRKNKWIVLFNYFGKDMPLKDFEVANGGKQKIYQMQKKLCFDRGVYSQGKRYRSIMKVFFKYCMTFEWIDSNPAEFAHPDENKINTTRSSRPKRNQHIDWKDVSHLMDSINENFEDYNLVDLLTKCYLMMSIRVGVIAALEWEWYDHEKDYWVIPAETEGLKNRKGNEGSEYDFIIPSTPEINQLMLKLRAINGTKEHVFWFIEGENTPYLCSDNINNRLKGISMQKQTGHGWRDVFVEGTQTAEYPQHIIDRCLGHTSHGSSSWNPYDEGKFIEERRKCMEWWTKELVNKGLVI